MAQKPRRTRLPRRRRCSEVQQQLDARARTIQAEIASMQRVAAAETAERGELQARIAELQSELDLVNARRNLHGTMSQFTYQSDANGSGANALKEHIDAIAASIPSSAAAPGRRLPRRSSGGRGRHRQRRAAGPATTGSARLGIWDLAANVLRLPTRSAPSTRSTAAPPPCRTRSRRSARRRRSRSRRCRLVVTPSRRRRIRPTRSRERRARSVRHAGVALQADRRHSFR